MKRIFSLLFLLTLSTLIISCGSSNNTKSDNTNDVLQNPVAELEGVELVEKRTANSKTYLNPDGTLTTRITAGPSEGVAAKDGLALKDVDHLTPDALNKTGYLYVNDNGTAIKQSNYLPGFRVGCPPDRNDFSYYRGFAEWDISSIPNNVSITSAEVHLRTNDFSDRNGNGSISAYLWQVENRPSTAAAATLYNDVYDGSNYGWIAWTHSGDTRIKVLNAAGLTDIRNSLVRDWFAVGVVIRNVNGDSNDYMTLHSYRSTSIYRPELVVTYPNPCGFEPGAHITVTSPDSNDDWVMGDSETVRWSVAVNNVDDVLIHLYNDSGTHVATPNANTSNDGSQAITVPDEDRWGNDLPAGQYRIGMSNTDHDDPSCDGQAWGYSEYFTISEPPPIPQVTLDMPSNNAVGMSLQFNLSWDNVNHPDVRYYRVVVTNNTHDEIVSELVANGTSYWIPAGILDYGRTYSWKVQAQSWDDAGPYSETRYFTTRDDPDPCGYGVPNPSITVTSPNGGGTWTKGQSYTVNWTSFGSISDVHIHLYKGNDNVYSISGSTQNDGSHAFTLPTDIPLMLDGDNYRVAISNHHATCDGGVWDYSNNYFSVQSGDTANPTVTVVSPNGGEAYQGARIVPDQMRISWNASDLDNGGNPGTISQIRLVLLKDNVSCGDITVISNPVANYYDWSIPSQLNNCSLNGANFRIAVLATDGAGNASVDESDSNFAMRLLNVQAPSGGYLYGLGTWTSVVWLDDQMPDGANVKISLIPDGGASLTIVNSTEGDGSYHWQVGTGTNNVTCNQCQVEVAYSYDGGATYPYWNRGTSFTIPEPPAPPEGGEGDPDSPSYLGGESLSEYSDEPINLATGNYYLDHTDVKIPGRGLGIEFKRHYNSKNSARVAPLGHNWTHSYDVFIENPEAEDVLNFYWGDGRLEKYSVGQGGEYVAQRGVHNTLSRNQDNTFTLTTKNGLKYNFTETGYLSSIVDRNNNSLSLTYTGTNLTRITAPAGRYIDFAYDEFGRILTITDQLNRTYSYAYDENDDLVSFTDPLTQMRSYTYDENHQMLTLSDFAGNIITTNVYTDGRVTAQTDARGNTSNLAYDTENRITTLTHPNNAHTTYYHDDLLRSTKVELHNGDYDEYTYDDDHNRTSVRDRNGNVTTFTYDTQGNMITRTDAMENVTYYAYDVYSNLTRLEKPGTVITLNYYDENGNLLRTIDPEEALVLRDYDDYGQLVSVTNARENTTTYNYDANGNLSDVTTSEENTTSYSYDDAGRMTSKTDPKGNQYTYIYDALDRLTQEMDPFDTTIQFGYDSEGRKTSITDKRHLVTLYQYDLTGNKIKATDPYGAETVYEYDSLNRLTRKTDPLGGITRYGYDVVGNLVNYYDPKNIHTSYSYDGVKNRTQMLQAGQRDTYYRFDDLNRNTEIEDELGNTIINTYDALGRITVVQDKLGNVTEYRYNKVGKVLEVEDPQGNIMAYDYDENYNKILERDPDGNETTYSYDGENRLIQINYPLGLEENYSYDANGNKSTFTDKSGHVWTYAYDALNRLTSVTDPLNGVTSFAYDANNNKTSTTDADGRTITFAYDLNNRLTHITDPLGSMTEYTYDALGRKISIIDAKGNIKEYSYDAIGNLTDYTDALGNVTSFNYDNLGSMTSMVRPGGETYSFGYDALGRKTSMIDPLSNAWSYTYNENNNMLTETNPLNETVTYTYDSNNRLSTVAVPGNDITTYQYNGRGLRTNAVNYPGNVSYGYDALGRLTSVQGADTVGYSYDALSRVATITYPDNGTVSYVYDDAGRLTDVVDRAGTQSHFTYSAAGLLNSAMYPNGNSTDYAYDNAGRLTGISHEKDAVSVIGYSYVLDEVGNIVSMSFSGDDLPSLSIPNLNKNYSYDGADRLLSDGDSQFTYDDAGRRITKTQNENQANYAYDALGRLTSLSVGEDSYSYLYNADNQLTRKTMPFADMFFVNDSNQSPWQVLSVKTTGNQFMEHFEYANGLLAKEIVGEHYYYHHDLLGNTGAVTSSEGSLENRYVYDPFGISLSTEEIMTNSNQFGGKHGVRVDEDNLLYMRDRFYDISVGGFISPDKAFVNPSNSATYHRYLYALNNPNRYIDPTGNIPEEVKELLVKEGYYTTDQSFFAEFWENISWHSMGKEMLDAITAYMASAGGQGYKLHGLVKMPYIDGIFKKSRNGTQLGLPLPRSGAIGSIGRGFDYAGPVFGVFSDTIGYDLKSGYIPRMIRGECEPAEAFVGTFYGMLPVVPDVTSAIDMVVPGFQDKVINDVLIGTAESIGQGDPETIRRTVDNVVNTSVTGRIINQAIPASVKENLITKTYNKMINWWAGL